MEIERASSADAVARAGSSAGVALWGSEAWRAEALAWLDTRLASHGITRSGAAEQPHLRPWATALRVPTSAGVVWLKAAGPGTAFEVRLYRVLARLAPEHVLQPLAIDEARGWVVLPDGGVTLGDVATGEALPGALCSALAGYARLQRVLSPHVEELVALGLSDMRAARMPERFEQALAVCESYVARAGSAHDRVRLERVVAQRPAFLARCRELESCPVPPSLDHNDLHPWNIFAAREGTAERAYDWGDSVVAHPFASLLVALGFVCRTFHAGAGDARVTRVRDAYLAAFADLGSHAELVRTAELACHVGKVARALTWARAIEAEGDATGPHAGAPLHWLGALLDPAYVIEGG
jgi:phosphotransferase family enzyme